MIITTHKFKNKEMAKNLTERKAIVEEGRSNNQNANKLLKNSLIEFLNTENYDFGIKKEGVDEISIHIKSGIMTDLIKAVEENEEINNSLMAKLKTIDDKNSAILYKEIVPSEFGKLGQYKLNDEGEIEVEENDAVEEFKEWFLDSKAKHNGIE
ncbi:MAG: hypothetical protein WCN88_04805 [Candidatus Falkowbacteria bacterium]